MNLRWHPVFKLALLDVACWTIACVTTLVFAPSPYNTIVAGLIGATFIMYLWKMILPRVRAIVDKMIFMEGPFDPPEITMSVNGREFTVKSERIAMYFKIDRDDLTWGHVFKYVKEVNGAEFFG